MKKSPFPVTITLILVNIFIFTLTSCVKNDHTNLPGRINNETILLPNHYRLTPAGKQIPVGDLPLNIVLSPDGKYLAVTNNGYSKQFISIIDVEKQEQVQTLPVRASFFGLDFSRDGNKLFASGGGKNLIYIFSRNGNSFIQTDSIQEIGRASCRERV